MVGARHSNSWKLSTLIVVFGFGFVAYSVDCVVLSLVPIFDILLGLGVTNRGSRVCLARSDTRPIRHRPQSLPTSNKRDVVKMNDSNEQPENYCHLDAAMIVLVKRNDPVAKKAERVLVLFFLTPMTLGACCCIVWSVVVVKPSRFETDLIKVAPCSYRHYCVGAACCRRYDGLAPPRRFHGRKRSFPARRGRCG